MISPMADAVEALVSITIDKAKTAMVVTLWEGKLDI